MSDTPNPYKICGGCAASPAEDCDHGAANCNDVHSAWQEGFNAGLEAAARECERAHSAIDEVLSRFPIDRCAFAERLRRNALIGFLGSVAAEIRAMKGGEGE